MNHTSIKLILLTLILTLAGCANALLEKPAGGGDPSLVTITIGGAAPRTLVPAALDDARYELSFSGHPTASHDPVPVTGGSATVSLQPGPWTITATAYAGDPETAVARGSENITVGVDTEVNITLDPITDSEVKGIFQYAIAIDSNVTIDSATLVLTRFPPAEPPQEPVVNVNLTTENLTDTVSSIPAGYYRLRIAIEAEGFPSGIDEVVYIYPGLTTLASYSFDVDGLIVLGEKAALSDAIGDAEVLVLIATIDDKTTGEVPWGMPFVTTAEKAAYQNAIDNAKAALAKPATEAQLTTALDDLDTATDTFNGAIKIGTLVSKGALETAIDSAKALLEDTRVDFDGDTPNGTHYVTTEEKGAFQTAIDAAQTVYDGTPDDAAIQAALTALATATDNFYAAFTFHVVEVDTAALIGAIDAATTALDSAGVDTDAANVPIGTKWVTQAVHDALALAISEAQGLDTDIASRNDVDDAASILNDAVDTFNDAKQDGAMPIVVTVTALDLSTLVTAPVKGEAPNTTAIDADQYTGVIVWNTSADAVHTGNFAANTVYKAIVTLTAKTGYTFTGVGENAFVYTFAEGSLGGSISHPEGEESGLTVTITFPATAADDPGQTAAPTASITTIAKTAAVQESVTFTLSAAYPAGTTWKVYAAETGPTAPAGVTVSVTGTDLTLTHDTDIPAADYWVSATETGKTESARLGLTVNPPLTADTRVLTIDTIPAFDEVIYGYDQPAAKNLTIRNSGNAIATISDVALSGEGASAFELGGSGSTVDADDSITTRTVQPKAGLAAGAYTETITVTYDGGATATAEVSITVNKATPVYTVPTGLVAIVGQTLADVALPPGFSWDTELNPVTTSVGSSGVNTFRAQFTHTDTINYEVVKNIAVNIAVSPAGKVITAWVAEHGIQTNAPAAVDGIIATLDRSEGESLTINVTDSGYGTSYRWTIGASTTPVGTEASYTFSAAGRDSGNYNLALRVVKDGEPYSTLFTITVQD
jgi:hypothetical protein